MKQKIQNSFLIMMKIRETINFAIIIGHVH